jgi:hypothetical protein
MGRREPVFPFGGKGKGMEGENEKKVRKIAHK